MFLRFILLVVCSVSFLRSFHVSSCESCADKPVFTPSRLVVKYGGSASASCSVCQHCLARGFDLEAAVGRKEKNGSMISWMVDKLTEWDTSPICFYKDDQCCSSLRITVYQPPDNVSISLVNHTGPMLEGSQYTLQCSVQNVAPVENLYVTFYRGQTQLGQPQSNSNNTKKKPESEIFTFNFIPSNEDDEGQLWCEAKLELGPEGPRPPPVVKSQSITATVHYKPQLEGSSHPDPITITEGDSLQLNCSAVANPRPSYTWTSPSPTAPSSQDSVFTIKSVTSADEGQYTCSVSNYLGTTTVEFNVTVEVANPTTVTSPTTVTNPTTVMNPTTVKSPTTVATTTERNRSSSSVLIHRFILCFTLLFSVLV